MSRRLVWLRHGQTEWNNERRIQGHLDIELSQTGHDQASAAGAWLAHFGASVLWSSDLARARQTAAYVAKETGLDVVGDARLREYDLGERSGWFHDDYREQFPDEYVAFEAGDFSVVPGAETPEVVARRLRAVVGDLLEVLGDDETAIVVSHGTAIRTAVLALTGMGLDLNQLRVLNNCGVAVLEQRSDDPTLMRLSAYGLQVPRL
ncbi:histidine phosphatase family protein [Nocardioides sp. Bht2]|uniref:histidine phosphatase family protein n=1 Tax=Nocardioides sp. Bht2 TaxID=3392297 RepID=UPI0039B46B8B